MIAVSPSGEPVAHPARPSDGDHETEPGLGATAAVPDDASAEPVRPLQGLRDVADAVRETVAPVVHHRPVHLLRRTIAKAWGDRVLGMSAEAAFWQLLSFPPLLLGLIGGLGYASDVFGRDTINSVRDKLLDAAGKVVTPNIVDQIIAPIINHVLGQGRADVISIGFVAALWAGSSSTATFVNVITIAYDMRDMRGAVRSRLLALWLYLGTIVVGIIMLPVTVLGPKAIIKLLPDAIRHDGSLLVNNLYWPAVILVLLMALATLYHLSLPKRLPWHRGLPGAMFAGAIFVGGSYAVRSYFVLVSNRANIYGLLAAPIAALVFLFLIALAILLGAEFNATLEQIWPSHTGRRARRRATKANHERRDPAEPGEGGSAERADGGFASPADPPAD